MNGQLQLYKNLYIQRKIIKQPSVFPLISTNVKTVETKLLHYQVSTKKLKQSKTQYIHCRFFISVLDLK